MQIAEQNTLWSTLLIQEMLEQGVSHFFIAPGSRNTPLVLAAAKSCGVKTVHFDERGLAYLALGYAKAAKKTCCLIVTSGTAVANLLPAVMEAHYSYIPLLILTADRPPELRECGANQTVDQADIFTPFVRWQFDLPCPEEPCRKDFLQSTIAYAVFKTAQNPSGPVHLNCMLREPLYTKQPSFCLPRLEKAKTQYFLPRLQLDLKERLILPKKGIILLGRLASLKSVPPVYHLAKTLGWPVFADILSQNRTFPTQEEEISSYDLLLKTAEVPAPEAILHFGDRIVSKKLFEWLAEVKPSLYGSILEEPFRHDPSHLVTHRFVCSPEGFCESMAGQISEEKDRSWLSLWKEKEQAVISLRKEYFKEEKELTEPKIMDFLSKVIPSGWAIFLGSSMPIRDADHFLHPESPIAGVFSNRGTSGIDGNIATLAGLSLGLQKPIVGCMGDQAFLYDLNSLPLLKKIQEPLLLIVFNNSGGGIFAHLPIAKESDYFSAFWKAEHAFSFGGAVRDFGIDYEKVESLSELTAFFDQGLSRKSMVLEIATDTAKNTAFYETFRKRLQKKFQEKELLCLA